MLRIINFKLAQQNPIQEAVRPYQPLAKFINQEWKNRKQRRNQTKLDTRRKSINGSCLSCGQFLVKSKNGGTYCPSCNSQKSV